LNIHALRIWRTRNMKQNKNISENKWSEHFSLTCSVSGPFQRTYLYNRGSLSSSISLGKQSFLITRGQVSRSTSVSIFETHISRMIFSWISLYKKWVWMKRIFFLNQRKKRGGD
jgi:hypothetical protein